MWCGLNYRQIDPLKDFYVFTVVTWAAPDASRENVNAYNY